MQSIISLTDIQKTFGEARAVDGLSLTVERGEVVALLGPNGAGKTTSISILLGLAAADHGTVELFAGTPADAVAAGRVGAMLQSGGLMTGVTIAELLTMLASVYEHSVALERVLGIAGLDGMERKRTDRLSGGEQQRVRLACALIGDPELLVLDEPTAAMDVEARRAFWAAMRAFAHSGGTILFSTHYLEEADAFADRIAIIDDGRLIADGSPSEVKAIVSDRVIRFRVPEEDVALLGSLPAVTMVDVDASNRLAIHTRDAECTLRALLDACADLTDIEVAAAGLEEVFLTLTHSVA
jgi:ABC-2 type transport system ATP-binding protein